MNARTYDKSDGIYDIRWTEGHLASKKREYMIDAYRPDRHVYVYTLSIQDWSEHCKKAYRVQQEQQHKQQTHTYRIQWPSEIWNTSMFVNLSCLRMKIYFHSSHEPVSPAHTQTHMTILSHYFSASSVYGPYISLSGRGKRRFGPCVLATAVDTNL